MKLLKLTVAALASALIALPATVSAAGELTIALASEPSSIDPHFHNLGPNNAVARVMFDRLIMPDDKQQLLPGCVRRMSKVVRRALGPI
jgi:peptide/nickel transport system substrate-binding protein